MTMTDETKEGPPGPDQDVPDLTEGVDSTAGHTDAPSSTPEGTGATAVDTTSALVKVGVLAVPRGWAPPKGKRAHRRARRIPWGILGLVAVIAVAGATVGWGLTGDDAPPQAPPAEPAPQDIPRLEHALGRPAEPPRAVPLEEVRVALFDIPALQIHTTLADGTDPGTGPILWPGTPWPGGPGRSVILLWADLSTLRPGHEVLVGDGGGYARWRVASVSQVPVSEWAEVARQSIVSELALVEAADVAGRTTRSVVIAWPVP